MKKREKIKPHPYLKSKKYHLQHKTRCRNYKSSLFHIFNTSPPSVSAVISRFWSLTLNSFWFVLLISCSSYILNDWDSSKLYLFEKTCWWWWWKSIFFLFQLFKNGNIINACNDYTILVIFYLCCYDMSLCSFTDRSRPSVSNETFYTYYIIYATI